MSAVDAPLHSIGPAALPIPPRDRATDGPVFKVSWEAQAFAMTVELRASGLFSWTERAHALSIEIASARDRGEDADGEAYYSYWLRALEQIVTAKSVCSQAQLDARVEAWANAAQQTPHGQPIELDQAARDFESQTSYRNRIEMPKRRAAKPHS